MRIDILLKQNRIVFHVTFNDTGVRNIIPSHIFVVVGGFHFIIMMPTSEGPYRTKKVVVQDAQLL